MIRTAKPGDEAAIEGFLLGFAETSMFLRANLVRFGLENRDHANATAYYIDEADGIRAVFGISNGGFVLVQAPDAGPEFWVGFHAALKGREVAGITGDVRQVAKVKATLGLAQAEYSLDRPEPLYRLILAEMRDPGAAATRPPTKDDLPLLRQWMYDYLVESLGAPAGDVVRTRAAEDAERALESGTTRLMIEDGVPVAKTAFNATLPDMVQIGGVYTPPEARSRGLARRVVAGHLREARGMGVKTAILFASGEPACRAYEAIGFERVGQYALAILADKQVVV